MKLADVATAAGISRSALWTVTTGRSAASVDVLAKLGAALGVDPVTFLRPYKTKSTAPDPGDSG